MDLTGIQWTTVSAVVVAAIGALATIIVKRLRSRASEPEMWERIQDLTVTVYGGHDKDGRLIVGLTEQLSDVRRKNAAQARVIRDLAQQWPTGTVPRLNPTDIAEMEEDTIPPHWRMKPPTEPRYQTPAG